jgi:hypothetical protein
VDRLLLLSREACDRGPTIDLSGVGIILFAFCEPKRDKGKLFLHLHYFDFARSSALCSVTPMRS